MSATLLATKFLPPLPSKCLVSRPRLLDKVEGCLRPGCRLTLVTAPAGFGKTTLVSAWLSAAGSRPEPPLVAWLSLDEQDRDPTRFWAYVCAALTAKNEALTRGMRELLDAARTPDLESALILLLNSLAQAPAPVLLVLDDFHLVDSPALAPSLDFLLNRIPPHVHLLLLTRHDPSMPLALLRGRGEMLEIRQTDLRFSSSETSLLLQACLGWSLTPGTVQALEAKIEGWAAGLQMACLALLAGPSAGNPADVEAFVASFSGSHRYILDYLAEQVLAGQPPEVREFLLATSVLEQLYAPLCDAVRGGAGDSQRLLEYLESRNLFTLALDGERRWFRYHPLFADLLRKRLTEGNPAAVGELHLRACLWLEHNQLAPLAVDHAFQAGDPGLAARLLEQVAESALGRGDYGWLLTRIQKLPPQQREQHPRLLVDQATILTAESRPAEAEACLAAAERQAAPDEQDWVAGRAAALRALMAVLRDDAGSALSFAEQALPRLAGEGDLPWRAQLLVTLSSLYLAEGDLAATRRHLEEARAIAQRRQHAYMFLDATSHLGLVLWLQGHLLAAGQLCRESLEFIRQRGLDQIPAAGLLYLTWGFLECEAHALESAETALQTGRRLCQLGGDRLTLAWANHLWMRFLIAKGDPAAAAALAEQTDALIGDTKFPLVLETGLAAMKVWAWVRCGKMREAEQFFRERGLEPDSAMALPHLGELRVLARWLLARGKPAAAEKLLLRLLDWANTAGQPYWALCARVSLALAYQTRGKRPEALDALARALEFAAPEGYLQVFVDESEALTPLVKEVNLKPFEPSFSRRLEAALAPSPLPAIPEPQRQAERSAQAAHLSAREVEVLRLMADGLANKEIAQKLYISLRTVKYHTTSLFTKLDVNNRTQAVARARERGIL